MEWSVISKQRLIDANTAESERRALAEKHFANGDVEFANGVMKAVTRVKESKTIEPPVVQWISVEDRLPEEMLRIILRFTENRNRCDLPMEGTTCGFLMGGTFYTDSGSMLVTHWMPLPEPPKEENNNGN